jgi:hypothetical protein
MLMLKLILITISLFFSTLCRSQTIDDTLFVFIGEKISIKRIYPKPDSNSVIFYEGYKAKYKIIKSIYGQCSSDTIEFEAYDHYGKPPFSKYENVMLFVTKHEGKLYHEAYQYFDVYKTKNGRWASSYKPRDYGHTLNKETAIKPEPIDFETPVYYKIKNADNAHIRADFPSPYYEIKDKKAFSIRGNYIEELFELKKNGILKARGFFSPGPNHQ